MSGPGFWVLGVLCLPLIGQSGPGEGWGICDSLLTLKGKTQPFLEGSFLKAEGVTWDFLCLEGGTGERGGACRGSVPAEGLFPRLNQTSPLHLWA